MLGFFVFVIFIAVVVAGLKSYYRKTMIKVANDPKLWEERVIKAKVTPQKQDEIQRKYGTGLIPLHNPSGISSNMDVEIQVSTQTPSSKNIVHVTEFGYLYDYEEAPPMPWEKRQIYTSADGRKFFIGWQGTGPETEFSLNRKSRVKIIPTKLMVGFDGKRYIAGTELPGEAEQKYCKDDISSQIKSKGHSADDFWFWAEKVLNCDTSIIHSLTVGYDHTTFETLWEGKGPVTEFTYRHALDRKRITIIPVKLERHRIDNTFCITGVQEGNDKPYRYFEKKIQTMLKSEGIKRLHLKDWALEIKYIN